MFKIILSILLKLLSFYIKFVVIIKKIFAFRKTELISSDNGKTGVYF